MKTPMARVFLGENILAEEIDDFCREKSTANGVATTSAFFFLITRGSGNFRFDRFDVFLVAQTCF